MDDLLPCPFCSGVGKAVQPSTLDGWTVHCTKCDTEGSEWIDEAAATRAWNRRIPAKTALDHFIDDVEAADIRDAARYRWLRTNSISIGGAMWFTVDAEAQEAIDAAMKGDQP